MVKGSKLCASATTRGNDHAGENILQPVQAEQAAGGRRSRSPAPPPRAALFRSSPVTTSVSDPVSQSPLRRARSILLAFPLLALSSLFIFCQRQGTQVKSPAGLKKKSKITCRCLCDWVGCLLLLPPSSGSPPRPPARPRLLRAPPWGPPALLSTHIHPVLSSALLNQTGETAPLSPFLPPDPSIRLSSKPSLWASGLRTEVAAAEMESLAQRAALLRESLQKSQQVTDAVVSILGSFDSRLTALDSAMRPIQVRPASSATPARRRSRLS